MNIQITLNGEKQSIQSPADTSLLSVLRKLRLLQVKRGCEEGCCGCCTVLINKKCVPSCKVPIALTQNKEIITLEYFSKTEDYQDIIQGFNKAGVKLCGYCNTGKIFTCYNIIKGKNKPTRASITEEIKHLAPCCTDADVLINGIIYAFDIHMKRKTDKKE